MQIRAILSVYSPLVLLPAASNPVKTHTYRKKTQTQDINDATDIINRPLNIHVWGSVFKNTTRKTFLFD